MPTATQTPKTNLIGLRAFKGDPAQQKAVIARIRQHQKMDEIVQGATGGGQYCAVACAFDNYDHGFVARELEIPCSLVYANENIFEGCSDKDFVKKWPLRFVSAIPLGADLSLVPHQLYVWLMSGSDSPYLQIITKKDTLELMAEGSAIMQKYIDGMTMDSDQWPALSKRAREASARADSEYWSALRALRALSDLRALRALSDLRALRDLSDLRALRDLRALSALRDLSDLRALRDQVRTKFLPLTGQKLLTLMAEAPVVKA